MNEQMTHEQFAERLADVLLDVERYEGMKSARLWQAADMLEVRYPPGTAVPEIVGRVLSRRGVRASRPSSLRKLKQTAAAWPMEKRRKNKSFSLHTELATNPMRFDLIDLFDTVDELRQSEGKAPTALEKDDSLALPDLPEVESADEVRLVRKLTEKRPELVIEAAEDLRSRAETDRGVADDIETRFEQRKAARARNEERLDETMRKPFGRGLTGLELAVEDLPERAKSLARIMQEVNENDYELTNDQLVGLEKNVRTLVEELRVYRIKHGMEDLVWLMEETK